MRKYKWLLIPIVGNIFEWYEFAIFSNLAGIIGKIFFDATDKFATLMLGALVYGIAYIARPFGTFLFGFIGDKYGRKKALSSSLILMFFATFIIPFIPSYEKLGYMSSLLLIIARILQGISFGGEFSSVVTYTCEMAPDGKKGLFASFHVVVVIFSIILGSLTVMFLNSIYTPEDMVLFGWKIPFFLAILIGIFGIYIRSKSTETEEFLQVKNEGKIVKNPFIYFFKNHYKEFLICATWILTLSTAVQAFTIGSKIVLEGVFKFNSSLAINCSILICILTIPFIVIAGFFVEKFELLKVRKFYTILLPILSLIGYYFISQEDHLFVFIGMLILSIAFNLLNGTYPYYFYKKIPTKVRDTGVGFSIAIPAVFAGGFGLLIFMKLFKDFALNGILIFIGILNLIFITGFLIDVIFSSQKKN